ncbi:monovalent cation:proton antiporter-2 (CPA2) family protein [Rhizobium sp. TRM96647]|uniref:monovalent cation:proton antiporter-2 (CPA2) family protein n=1 Tax=unclassified Rhizobium TaxID=2613769 RepID=UPI0021E88B97|nr:MULTISPECIES: monovalent cation:proton antiporter-2 (CPA2) family protein [unclassified Rhizobium]MCV3737939.1 monovalent cation:proton antiporter-2 (CPA2) family protein [Rhizobium sp. TRM96647]MCV3759626.1 monovalent cation:proton antiporter-2 (CPA2) family protein [Rhizobium sp. TRM96650]
MAAETASHGVDLIPVVTLLAAGVIAVPLFKRFGLDSVLGYLAAGLVIGPFGLGLFTDAQSIIHVAELGVVMFLFVIGLEMRPSRLWGLRSEIMGLGLLQVVLCSALLTFAGMALGYSPSVAFVFGMGFVLTSTAIVFQILNDRGELSTPKGQRIVSILLLEDLAIVPLLAAVAFMAPGAETSDLSSDLMHVAIALGALAALILIGRYLLNPLFKVLAQAGAREVMTAAALLVVLGAALAMQLGGLSMAMGAFLAGVMLSESTFRHQLEADIEPFRGILLGLFFLGVGMALDVDMVISNFPLISFAVVAFMLLKGIGIYAVARLLRSDHEEAIERAALMAQGGEFAFVLYAAATTFGVIDAQTNAIFTSTVIISMVLTPLVTIAVTMATNRLTPAAAATSLDGIDAPDGLTGNVLIVGFGRFGQIVSQPLLARGLEVSIIDNDVEMIQAAAEFGFKVYYGDGTRLDILHAAGAENVGAIIVCVDKADVALHIVELAKAEFPLVQVFARAYDRGAALSLIAAGVDYQLRETLESALVFGCYALTKLGVPELEAEEIMEEVRRRDEQRLAIQQVEGLYGGKQYFQGNRPTPTPLTTPKRTGRSGNAEAEAVLKGSADAGGTAAT